MSLQCANNAQTSRVKSAYYAHDILVRVMHKPNMDKEWFKDRKRELRITDADVALALGVERSVANKVLNGKVAINSKRFEQMAALFQISLDELLFRAGVTASEPESLPHQTINSSPNITVWGQVAAGVWLEETPFDEGDDSRSSVPYDQMAGDFGTEHLFAVEPVGESMNMAFMPGTILICRKIPFGMGDVESGDYVIVARENHGLYEMTCKRIEVDENNDFLLFSESSDPKYSAPFKVPRSNDFEFFDGDITVVGVVIREVRDRTRKRQ